MEGVPEKKLKACKQVSYFCCPVKSQCARAFRNGTDPGRPQQSSRCPSLRWAHKQARKGRLVSCRPGLHQTSCSEKWQGGHFIPDRTEVVTGQAAQPSAKCTWVFNVFLSPRLHPLFLGRAYWANPQYYCFQLGIPCHGLMRTKQPTHSWAAFVETWMSADFLSSVPIPLGFCGKNFAKGVMLTSQTPVDQWLLKLFFYWTSSFWIRF